jgi:hypothetical protein
MHASVQCGQARPVRPRYRSGSTTPPSRTRRKNEKDLIRAPTESCSTHRPQLRLPLQRLHTSNALIPAITCDLLAYAPAGFRGPASASAYFKITFVNNQTKVFFLQKCHGCASPEACWPATLLCVWMYLMTFSVSSRVRLRFGMRTVLYRANKVIAIGSCWASIRSGSRM